MISFVNSKINIGLQIVSRRKDGYHNLQTIFYPIGKHSGTPENPLAFCDILEITESIAYSFEMSGRDVNCDSRQNLVCRAVHEYFSRDVAAGFLPHVSLHKNLPFGAGIGGGSADAAFTLSMLAQLEREYCERIGVNSHAPNEEELRRMALKLGADVPFFIYNEPAYAEGIGERLEPMALDLSDKWLVLVKPDIYISTKDAFAGVTPRFAEFDLRELCSLPLTEWKYVAKNDFEDSIFPRFPEMKRVKNRLYEAGAEYASLTGSGSCLYGIFSDRCTAVHAVGQFSKIPTILHSYLLKM
ncbi:MAG: 4-(cytidine 5'-diphospho)-2-C-methyl-D-erythritol kinase [Candidatus Amulumruptor caecigallinarius]|nr:4-(cytidine 5'-diphospho)-2-C-methyl-D-erythritol kinase [Candidatus Amulumruptor caecigallinarius]